MFTKTKTLRNPFLLFLPLLLLYVLCIYIRFSPIDIGDEGRFLYYANNLLKGSYSPPYPDIYLVSGPGYPLLIAPLIALGASKMLIVLLNAVMLYLSVVFVFKTIHQMLSFKVSFIFALSWGCYYMAYQNLALVSYEVMSYLLITILFYCVLKAFQKDQPNANKYLYLSGFALGLLILTKIIFGYVVMLLLPLTALSLLVYRYKKNLRRLLGILSIGFLILVPYLVYTYSITSRVFYMGTGSDNLYWMTTPYDDEYGDWKGHLNQNPIEYSNYNTPDADSVLQAHHGKNYEKLDTLRGLQLDDAFKEMAIKNIKEHPGKFAGNILFNISRMIFHYPYSYAYQKPKTTLIFPINAIIFTLTLLALIPTLCNWKKILFPIRFMLILTLVYIGGSLVGSAEARMLVPIVPVLIVWFAYVYQKTVHIRINGWYGS